MRWCIWLVMLCSSFVSGIAGSFRISQAIEVASTSQPAEVAVKDMVKAEVEDVVATARKLSFREMLIRDLNLGARLFFPDGIPRVRGRAFELMFVILTIMWFVVYQEFIYQSDRNEDFSHWHDDLKMDRHKDNRVLQIRPDVVLVFHHPTHYSGQSTKLDLNSEDKELAFAPTPSNANRVAEKKVSATTIKATLPFSEGSSLSRMSGLASEKDVSYQKVRESLLQDIVEYLPGRGIHVGIFSSMDEDELFVCLSLRDEKWVRHYVNQSGTRLQLNTDIVKHLEIGKPGLDSLRSPPFFRYDHHMATNLFGHDANPKVEDSKIYKVYGANRSILMGQGRIRVINSLLAGCVDLDRAVQAGFMVKWYPCHSYNMVQKLRQYWGNWTLIRDFTCVQPIPLLQEYFSSRVAFVFAWNGLYAKFLLALVPVAMIFCLADVIAEKYGEASLWTQGTVLGFSLVVAYWGKFVANQWRREEAYLRVLWDLEGIGQDAAVRPDFHGEEVPSPIDKNMKMQEYPIWKFRLRQAASWSITLAFCSCVVTFVLAWKEQFPGNVSLMGSVVLALMIQLFTFTFSNLVEFLTIHENHKLQRHYYESYLRKTFVFEFINQYTAFFYIAIKQQFAPGGCPLNAEGQHDCLLALKKQLPSTLLILMAMEIVQVVLANVKVRASLQWEYFSNERKRTHSYLMALRSVRSMCCGREQTEEENRHHNFVEVQGKFGPYRTREQIETMTRLCLNIGFCLIFGGVVPIIVPMCLLAFFVQLRARATLLTSATDRPVPRRTTGLGPWLSIIELLMDIAVVFNAYVLVNYGPLFTGLPTLSKLSGFILYVFVVKAMWSFHDVVSPASSDLAELLHQRREHIVSKLLIKESECRRNKAKKKEEALEKTLSRHVHTNFVEEALKGEWDKIPTISKMSPAIAHQMGLC
mmetsp:Transcript_54974/g.87229  ORF Transcript_54974/g.87229 Transcript_54974/m.87229 type:complete len:921 (+) Transcript_54974:112-2874(+)